MLSAKDPSASHFGIECAIALLISDAIVIRHATLTRSAVKLEAIGSHFAVALKVWVTVRIEVTVGVKSCSGIR